MDTVTEEFQAYLNILMTNMVGLLVGALLTGILLSLGISSLFLLSSKGRDRNLLRRNRFLRVYIIILLSTVLIFDAEAFVGVNRVAIFFSQPRHTAQELTGIWAKVLGLTTAAIVLLADGVLVRLTSYLPFNSFKHVAPSRYGGVLWSKKLLDLSGHPSGETCFGLFLFVYGS